MAPIQSCYGCEGKIKNKLAREGGYVGRYRNCYRAIYPSASHNRRKEKVVRNIAACKRHGLS